MMLGEARYRLKSPASRLAGLFLCRKRRAGAMEIIDYREHWPWANLLSTRKYGGAAMVTITLSATPGGNGYQGTISFSDDGSGPKPWVSISSAETYPTIAEAMTAAALKLLSMPKRLEALDRVDPPARP
jgi:hypothetical protein